MVELPGRDLASRLVDDPDVVNRDRDAFLKGGKPSVVAVAEVTPAMDLPNLDRPVLTERLLPKGSGVVPQLLPYRLNGAVKQFRLGRTGDIQGPGIDPGRTRIVRHENLYLPTAKVGSPWTVRSYLSIFS